MTEYQSELVACLGCPDLAREKIMSILQHVSNVHSFGSFEHFKKCEHGTLDEQKPWIAPGINLKILYTYNFV